MDCCDVLVIGLGPAGASAALSAARAGAAVLAVERGVLGREPARCAEWAPLALGGLARRLGAEVRRVAGMRTHLPSGDVTDSPFPGVMLDRPRFDAALAREAASAGVTVREKARLAGLDAAAGLAWLSTGEKLAFRALVAADGPRSTVARLLGLAALECAVARQISVPSLEAGLERAEVFLSADYPGGYGWLFPKGAAVNLGIGVAREAAGQLEGLLASLHARLMAEKRVGGEIWQRSGGAIPCGGLREPLVRGPVLFAGDAAGLAHPVTGAGIHPAVMSGEWAGEAAARFAAGDGAALAEYEAQVREVFGPGMALATARRRERRAGGLRKSWIAFPEYFQPGSSIRTRDHV